MNSTSKTNIKGCKSSESNLRKLLCTAASEGRYKDVTRLIQEGASFLPDGPIGNNPLHLAAMNGHLEVCKILLNLKVLIDTTNMVEKAALHMAAVNGHTEIVDLLLTSGASVDIRDMLEMTPLHWACERGHFEVASLLLQRGADPQKLSKFGKSPRYIALEKDYPDIVDLIEFGTKDSIRRSRPMKISDWRGDKDNIKQTHSNVTEDFELLRSKYAKHIHSEATSVVHGLLINDSGVKHTYSKAPDDFGLQRNKYNIKETQSEASATNSRLQNDYGSKDTHRRARNEDSGYSSDIFTSTNIEQDADASHFPSFNLNGESTPFVSNVEDFSSEETLEDLLNRSCDLNSDLDEEDIKDRLLKSLEELGSTSSLNSVGNDIETSAAELLRAQAALSIDDPFLELKTAASLGQTLKLTEAGMIALSMIVPEPFIIPYEDKSKRKDRENSTSESVNDKGECSTVALRNQTIGELYNELMTESYNFEAKRSCRSPSTKRSKS